MEEEEEGTVAQTTSEKDCRNEVVMTKKLAGNQDTVHMVDQLRMKLAKMKNW
jgi:hypothetical protein